MKTKKSFLEYSKKVLSNFTFDKTLFWKEYQKAKRYLKPKELLELDRWVSNMIPRHLLT